MKKRLKILITILVIIAFVLIASVFLIDRYAYNSTLKMSDWLVAGCSILSTAGTVTLAIISVTQNEKANEQNQALIKQNEDLQKISNTQFKIANQKYYPILDVDNVVMTTGKVECPLLQNWECNFSKTIDKLHPIVFLNIEARLSDEKEISFYSQVKFSIINNSASIVQKIEIYKLSASSLINSIVDTTWDLTVFTLSKGKMINIEMKFRHNKEILITRRDALNYSIYLRITTITNVIFYEKMSIFASPSFSYGIIEKISENQIDN